MRTVGISNHAAQRFASFVDLDVETGIENVDRAVREILRLHHIPWAWVLRTKRGYHVVAPFCFTFKETLAIHRALDPVGADDTHRRVAITNGRFILRVTEKPDSPAPVYVRTVPGARSWESDRRRLLVPIALFYSEQMACPMPPCLNARHGRGQNVRLEAYDPLMKEDQEVAAA